MADCKKFVLFLSGIRFQSIQIVVRIRIFISLNKNYNDYNGSRSKDTSDY